MEATLAPPGVDLAALLESARTAERAGTLDEALQLFEAALWALPCAGDAATAADILRWIGTLHRQRGHTELAIESYEVSLAIAAAADLPYQRASALNCVAIIEQFRAETDRAHELYLEARELAEQVGDERLSAMIDQNLGTLSNIQGDVSAALAYYGSALHSFRRLGEDQASTWALNNMGMAHVDLEEWSKAETCYDEAFDIADRLRDQALLGTIELNRAGLQLKRKEYRPAREHCDRAFEIFARLESSRWLAEAYKFYGVLYRDMGMVSLAESQFRQATQLAEKADDRLLEAECHAEWALLHLAGNRNPEALASLNRAHHLFEQLRASRALHDLDRRLDHLEATYLRVVREWGESIESKDLYTAGHCQRVADYTCMIAEVMGFAGRELTWLRMGAFLHDVGKIAVPADVLNKPGKLLPEEWELMKSHAAVGDEIVAPLNFPWDIRPVVRNHHERWDGTGYPDGLSGEEIPLTARILCVADVYDALTTARSYRPALSHAEAIRIMERDAGVGLDAAIFEVFRTLISQRQQRAA